MIDDDAPSAYSRQVGERLRAIRKQKRLSLQEVEAQSDQEFKASVLGAYERGERALSVPRLDRLAMFYAVPIEQLLPREVSGSEASAALEAPSIKKLAIDVVKLVQLKGAPFEMLSRYLRSDPGAAPGLQRTGHHRAWRRRAGDRVDARRTGRSGRRSARRARSAVQAGLICPA